MVRGSRSERLAETPHATGTGSGIIRRQTLVNDQRVGKRNTCVSFHNRRFRQLQAIAVFAAEVQNGAVRIDSEEHSEYGWFSLEQCLEGVRVNETSAEALLRENQLPDNLVLSVQCADSTMPAASSWPCAPGAVHSPPVAHRQPDAVVVDRRARWRQIEW